MIIDNEENKKTSEVPPIEPGKRIVEEYLFEGKGLESIIIPDSILGIGDAAFSDNQLTNIELPKNLIIIGNMAFGNNKLKSIKIPNSVTEIGLGAFKNNDLISVELPENLKIIEFFTFANNDIESIIIPDSVEEIGTKAFINNLLTSVKLSERLIKIGANAFLNNKLESIIIPNSVEKIETGAFNTNELTSAVLSNNLLKISPLAFANNKLTSIIFPEKLKIIGELAFTENEITSLIIPNSVEEIGARAFASNKLTSVTLSEKLTEISFGSFSNNKLTNVIIPNNVEEIGATAFAENKLTSVTLPEKLTQIGSRAFCDNKISKLIIPNSVEEIGATAFAENKLTSVTLPEKLKIINESTFVNNHLTSIVIPDNVEEIGANAFMANYLISVKLPENLKTIKNAAFADNQIESIKIPNSVEEIEASAFQSNNLISIELSKNLKIIGKKAFAENKLTKVIIPEGVKTIGPYAFQENQLTHIEIPNSVEEIETSAFLDNNLTSVKLPENLTKIDSYTFAKNQLSEINLPSTITTIEKGAFAENKLTKVIIPEGVKTISSYAFKDNNLTLVEIPNSVTRIGYSAFDSKVILKNNNIVLKMQELMNNYNRKKITDIDEYYNNTPKFQKICHQLLNYKLNDLEKYNEILYKIEKIYPKTRLENLPPLPLIEKMNIELIEKFDFKVWSELKKYDIFSYDENMENALLEIINVFGLFNKDKNNQNRINDLKNLLKDIDYRLTEEQYDNLANENFLLLKLYKECKVKELRLKPGAAIPEELNFYLKERISPARYKYIKRLTGNEGKQVNEALKDLYETKESKYYTINDKNTKEENEKLKEILLTSDITGKINIESIHRIFSNCPKEFNEEAYKFLITNMSIILEDEKIQSLFPTILKKFNNIKETYGITDNIPTLKQCVNYCEDNKFIHTFGNKELLKMAQNAGITTQEAYNYYEELNKKLEQRKASSLVRHKDTYEYNGITLKGELLRNDDPFAMFVGESNYTNCCQRYNREGQQCMEHSATSQDGGIFVVSYLKEGKWIPLTESWDWQNEGVYCHDNIEATEELKKHPELKEAVAHVYQKDAEKIIEKSSKEIDDYVEKRTKKLERINITQEEKEEELKRLEELKKRQKIKLVTVGEGYSDINLDKYFETILRTSRQPKQYTGYSDAKGSQQHIIAGTPKNLIKEDTSYTQQAIYKDERRIEIETGYNIKESTLKLLCDIEKTAYPEKMKIYSKSDKPIITNPYKLAQIYGEDTENLKILHGEDWYTVYGVSDTKIEVYDMAKGTPRLEEEQKDQTTEINNTLRILLEEQIKEAKPIVADLKEDTSYLLYLMYLKSGLIEQIGEDYEYQFDNEHSKKVVTKEEQMDKLKRIKEIRNNKNQNLLMHRITFKASSKYIKSYKENIKNSKKI